MIGMPTAAVSRRTARFDIPFAGGASGAEGVGSGVALSDMQAAREGRPRVDPRSVRRGACYTAEAPIARLICGDRLIEVRLREVRPERVGEVQLGVGGGPEEEVA